MRHPRKRSNVKSTVCISQVLALPPLRLNPDAEGLRLASDIICNGGLVAFPTETVYGLGGDAGSEPAIQRIFAAKGRPSFNPLIIHVPEPSRLHAIIELNSIGLALVEAFWPGPLTLIARPATGHAIARPCFGSAATLAVRSPDHLVAKEFLAACRRPVAAPSANLSGKVSPTNADHVLTDLGGSLDAVIDGGSCRFGLESTIVDVSVEPAKILRPGALDQGQIESIIGPVVGADTDLIRPDVPGGSKSHYAPESVLRRNAAKIWPHEVWIGFGPAENESNFNLSPEGDLNEAAGKLYAMLREADRLAVQKGHRSIAVSPIPSNGIGEAINDRLRRAAAPRISNDLPSAGIGSKNLPRN